MLEWDGVRIILRVNGPRWSLNKDIYFVDDILEMRFVSN